MHASLCHLVPKGTDQLNCTCKALLHCWRKMCIYGWGLGWLPRRFAQFLGRAVDYDPDLCKFMDEKPCWGNLCKSCQEFWHVGLCNHGAQQAAIEDCAISRGKVGCPPELSNFKGEATKPTARPSPSEQLVRGMDQVVTDRLPLCKKDIEACELD